MGPVAIATPALFSLLSYLGPVPCPWGHCPACAVITSAHLPSRLLLSDRLLGLKKAGKSCKGWLEKKGSRRGDGGIPQPLPYIPVFLTGDLSCTRGDHSKHTDHVLSNQRICLVSSVSEALQERTWWLPLFLEVATFPFTWLLLETIYLRRISDAGSNSISTERFETKWSATRV